VKIVLLKKYLPFIILGLGVLVFVVAFFIMRRPAKVVTEEDEEGNLIELKLEEIPVVSLTPTTDGHYLNLKIEKIKVPKAVTMDFQFLYDVPDKVQQGSSGDDIDISSGSFESELLLGSESAGKFRYDEGVEKGVLTLWFRDSDKKLVTKLETEFHMQSDSDILSSNDEIFKFELEKSKGIYVVMNTLGLPDGYEFDINSVKSGPYGVFSESTGDGNAVFTDAGDYYKFDGNWGKSDSGMGIFVLLKSSE